MRILVSGSTRTVREVAARYPAYLGHLTTPRNGNRQRTLAVTGLPWAADNGAFSGFDEALFRRMLGRCVGLPNLLWVVCPDVVADAAGTLLLFEQWVFEIRGLGLPVALVLQDGQENLPVPWRYLDAVFIGGSTAWKLGGAAYALVCEARRRRLWVHCGRCNTLRRLTIMHEWGCDSVDGSCYSRWADDFLERSVHHLRGLDRQPLLEMTP